MLRLWYEAERGVRSGGAVGEDEGSRNASCHQSGWADFTHEKPTSPRKELAPPYSHAHAQVPRNRSNSGGTETELFGTK
jgi:hypothetical protein